MGHVQVHLKALEKFLGFVFIHMTCVTQLPQKYFSQRIMEGDKKMRQRNKQ
jgi:hypothetical protein